MCLSVEAHDPAMRLHWLSLTDRQARIYSRPYNIDLDLDLDLDLERQSPSARPDTRRPLQDPGDRMARTRLLPLCEQCCDAVG